jgi:hypothetical protein
MNPQLEERKATLAEMRQLYLATARNYFTEGTKELFEKYPTMESFGWRQYTPYFNDGDECKFRVNIDNDDVYVNGISFYDDDGDLSEELEEEKHALQELLDNVDVNTSPFVSLQGIKDRLEIIESGVDKPAENLYKAVSEFLNQFDEDIFEDLYANHSTITIHRDGHTEVEEYDHD